VSVMVRPGMPLADHPGADILDILAFKCEFCHVSAVIINAMGGDCYSFSKESLFQGGFGLFSVGLAYLGRINALDSYFASWLVIPGWACGLHPERIAISNMHNSSPP
jgi:hypothetical protein